MASRSHRIPGVAWWSNFLTDDYFAHWHRFPNLYLVLHAPRPVMGYNCAPFPRLNFLPQAIGVALHLGFQVAHFPHYRVRLGLDYPHWIDGLPHLRLDDSLRWLWMLPPLGLQLFFPQWCTIQGPFLLANCWFGLVDEEPHFRLQIAPFLQPILSRNDAVWRTKPPCFPRRHVSPC